MGRRRIVTGTVLCLPGLLCQREWSHGRGDRHRSAIHKVAARDVAMHAEFFIGKTHGLTLSTSLPVMSHCDRKIIPTENAKMSVAIAFISGVAPRRRRDQISSGSVFSLPIRKKVTAISSI